MSITMVMHTTTLIEKKCIGDEMYEIRFAKPKNFAFQAGQFVQIVIPQGENSVFRSYSISSTPQEDYIELCVKLFPDGVGSNYFRSKEIGQEIILKDPAGRFVLDSVPEDVYFIATGTGLGPIMGIIRDELENKKNKNKLHLIFGIRHEKNIFWADRLDELQKNHSNFTYSLTLSQPEDSWTGLRGRVTEHLPADTSNLHAFLCGSADMVKTVREMLTTRGTEVSKIHFEIF